MDLGLGFGGYRICFLTCSNFLLQLLQSSSNPGLLQAIVVYCGLLHVIVSARAGVFDDGKSTHE